MQRNYTHVTVCVEQQDVYVIAEGLYVTDKATSSNVSVGIKERLCFRSAEIMNYTKTVSTCIKKMGGGIEQMPINFKFNFSNEVYLIML